MASLSERPITCLKSSPMRSTPSTCFTRHADEAIWVVYKVVVMRNFIYSRPEFETTDPVCGVRDSSTAGFSECAEVAKALRIQPLGEGRTIFSFEKKVNASFAWFFCVFVVNRSSANSLLNSKGHGPFLRTRSRK